MLPNVMIYNFILKDLLLLSKVIKRFSQFNLNPINSSSQKGFLTSYEPRFHLWNHMINWITPFFHLCEMIDNEIQRSNLLKRNFIKVHKIFD